MKKLVNLENIKGGKCMAPELTPGYSGFCEQCALINAAALANSTNFELCALV